MPPLDRWRDAIERYRSAVVVARLVPLLLYARAFATYLNDLHTRVHPWFTDHFLAWLDRQPAGDPTNAPGLVMKIELAIASDGQIAHLGVVQSSGVPGFDASALESFSRARPFEPTPEATRSADGHLWVPWEFRRDEIYACSTMGARPFLMRP